MRSVNGREPQIEDVRSRDVRHELPQGLRGHRVHRHERGAAMSHQQPQIGTARLCQGSQLGTEDDRVRRRPRGTGRSRHPAPAGSSSSMARSGVTPTPPAIMTTLGRWIMAVVKAP